MKIHIANGRLIDPAHDIDQQQDVYIARGKIVGIGSAPDDFVATQTIDATGKIICPGLVDLAARLREPGFEYLATLESEMEAAMAGGVTSLAIPPDTDPPLDEPGLVEMLCYRAKKLNRAHVYPVGALTERLEGKRLSEMAELVDAGCVAFSQANTPIVDTQVLFCALQYAATFGYRVWLQPIAPRFGHEGVAHDGEVATRLGLPGIPTAAETIALFTYIELARLTGAKLHITRLSSAEGLALVRAAKAEGLDITCDVSINHLHLSDMDIGYFNAHCRLNPPLRSQRDRDALQAALATGDIDALCSNHSPIDDDAKQVPFSEAEPGATGIELLLPLALKWGQSHKLSLLETLRRVTINPARIIGSKAGQLSLGARADICIFDAEGETTVTRERLRSQGKNTPFLGHNLPGKVCYTVVEGKVMYAEP
ncbi:dihydroorotase [Denitromonas ohlonensis]|uniref:Dihydroorotase n=2 Tax=Denitromonas TaxID=139331 RepID=A0A557S683_9RHOO|nr:dihydroorotase [Denitromonas ohlonensis]TVO68723.1 dihydroorotase [Denitromonas ohlonensis]TVO72911.1 dihydroorotase [Denitromonas ohlonensis]TVT49507.1 MAG: dihydroorotase [Denitromonas halophila]TVT75341.1 MAG: dihydroorotase [Denitromonas halophila]